MEALTIKELIEQLSQYDEEQIVISGSCYGDRIGTIQANAATEVGEVFVRETSYSDSGYKIIEDGHQEDDDQSAIIINYDIF